MSEIAGPVPSGYDPDGQRVVQSPPLSAQPSQGDRNPLFGILHHPAELLVNDMEQKVLDVIHSEATSVNEIVVCSGLPIPQVLATLSVLEMRHLIRRLSGTTVIRL